MPRTGRINIPGGIYHVIQRGINRCHIYHNDSDRKEFVKRLEETIRIVGHSCYGWVLMPNHFHLIIRTGVKTISELMRKLLTGYALYFNKKHKRTGYLFQGRYRSILCQEDKYLKELIRYVHLNPLRAGLVKCIEDLEKYKWSGHAFLLNNNESGFQNKDEILSIFGSKESKAKENYLKFIEDGISMGKREDLIGGGLRRSAGGWEGVVKLMEQHEQWLGDERILGEGEYVERVLSEAEASVRESDKLKRDGWNFEKLIYIICKNFAINRWDLKAKGRENKISKAKMKLAYFGKKRLKISSSELCRELGCNRAAVGYLVREGEKRFRDTSIM